MRKYIVIIFPLLFIACLAGCSQIGSSSPSYQILPSAEQLVWEDMGMPEITGVYAGVQDFAVDQSQAIHFIASTSEGTISDHKLIYATNKGGSWVREIVDQNVPSFFYDPCIALDTSGNPHVVATKGYEGVKYYTRQSGSWEANIISVDTYKGRGAQIVLDSHNSAHVAFYRITVTSGGVASGEVYYFTNKNGSWEGTELEVVGYVTGQGTLSILVDTSDNVHLSYYNKSESCYKYATNQSGAWVTTIIDVGPGIVGYSPSGFNSLARDSGDKMCFIGESQSSASDMIRYATNVSGTWEAESILEYPSVSSLQLLLNSAADKAYVFINSTTVGYGLSLSSAAARTDATAWRYCMDPHPLTSFSIFGGARVKIDANDKIHLVFYDQNLARVKYYKSK